ncbi:WD repeat-containing protein on Y chromosome-like isoform X2 [Engraulis encrasicolus]|uniref:WD repeat-containing protein on Y chromosome-like isoform X2 n=1 Tax=Engraulis encrasicolus TaxID=184585 RepID=UPI002FD76F9C
MLASMNDLVGNEVWPPSDADRNKNNGPQYGNNESAESAKEEGQGRMEEQINDEHLRRIEAMFHEADTDGGGGLDMEEFRDAMKKIMGNVEEEDLDILFMKVDTNCDGTVDWDEYLNYMLLEYREKDSLQKQNRPLYFPKPLKVVPVAHCEPIVRIQFHPYQAPQADKKVGEKGAVPKTRMHGRYLTVSRDGILNYWSERFKLTRTINLDHMKRTQLVPHSQPVWVTDMICLSNLNLLALASTGRDVEFFDISANKCDIVFSLTGLEGYVVVMDYWTDGTKAIFSVGDVDGAILVFISHDVLHYGLFNSGAIKSIKPGGRTRLAVPALLKNTSKCYLCFKVALHNEWCHQIRFLPELNAVATCCASDNTAMVLTSIPHSPKAKVYNSAFQLRKGILCFDYSAEFNIIVTGGFDRIVRVWNPYVTNCATCQMKGHSAAVTNIFVNGKINKIISISKDKNVRVWDLQDCACLQSIHSRNMPMGRFPIFNSHYNPDTHTLVMSTFLIGVLHGVVDDVDSIDKMKTSHEHSLCTALYNSNFKQVVSGCHNGVISVWDIMTGEKVMQFQTSPERAVEVTAMSFDGPMRRLITGSKDGTIRLWNFNNGALLLTLPLRYENEVTGILYINQRIYISGWSKRVMWYLDIKEDMEMEYRVWNQYHAEDIYSMHAHGGKMLVTASYSGDIIVWNIDSGRAFCRFNASESPRPLMPNRVIDLSHNFEACESRMTLGSMQSDEEDDDEEEEDTGDTEGHSELQRHSPFHQAGQRSSSQTEVTQSSLENNRSSKSLKTKSKDKKTKPGTINAEDLERPRLAVEKALFLGTRERSPDTAILLTSAADGHIYAWSIHHQGGLLGKFRAVHGEGTSISSMSTDLEDQMLLTGDTQGYIMLWDIAEYCYCMQGGQEAPAQPKRGLILPSLIPKYCRLEGPRRIQAQTTQEVIDGWTVSLLPPPLLSSWRCHVKSVVSVEYVERFHLIVTAGLDCNVRVWTIAGGYVGTFGQAQWRVGNPMAFPWDLPIDLRRIGSSQTLKVLNRGSRPHWHCTRRILHALSLQRKQASSSAADNLELVTTDPRIAKYTDEQIEQTWKKWAVKGKQESIILGQTYKPKVRHHLPTYPPDLQSSFSSREQLRVYKAIPCFNLLPIIQPPVPDLLKEPLQKTQEGAEGSKHIKQKRMSRRAPMRFLQTSKAVCKKNVITKLFCKAAGQPN